MIVALALIFPSILQAQGELTLENLSEIVKGLETRLIKIESLFSDAWSPEIIYKDDGTCQSPLHTEHSSSFRSVKGEIHQETADAYRMEYGVSISPTSVYLTSISFGVDSNHVYLEYSKENLTVVEKWAHCEFLGHSKWRAR